MKRRQYLMTNICYRNEGDDKWYFWSYTDGDPTGREYTAWYPEDMPPLLDKIVEYLNSYIVCIYEKTINPVELKFNLRRQPEPDESNYGFREEYWETQECHFTKHKTELV
jgi:hypothetical protein